MALSSPVGPILNVLLAPYIAYSYISDRRHASESAALHLTEAESVSPVCGPLPVAVLLFILWLAGVAFGADLLVSAAIDLARRWGASETEIGLTHVAIGASLSELVTSVMAAVLRQPDVAFGNVIGSNNFNALGIVGTTSLVEPLAVPTEIARFDAWVMLEVAILLHVFAVIGWHIGWREGGVLLLLYATYITVLMISSA